MDRTKINFILRLFPCFSDLSDLDWLLAETVHRSPSSLHAITEGHHLKHAPFILSGCIRIYKLSPSGREVTLYRVHAGECCVLMMASILGETEYEASVQIEMDTEILIFPVEPFRQFTFSHQSVRQFFYKQFIDRFVSVTRLLEQIAFGSLQERIAAYIIRLHDESKTSSEIIKITHEQIAVELGTAREVVSRILKGFAQDGAIIVQRGKIAVIDSHKLLSYASLS